ncbi:hypothetical protein HMPREF0290_0296 [Corynebacterium efficiens YS-314]|uniref:LytR/CpsA/Psr regulator C-terminal domain-containing protein n=1 Tax=Corynebacterium efficiens (strain DSM 44549 / YS-314 / AJ 12310 / JCM 11189 / NBRC 100395) TaxID=196164 RepID=Q8FMD2_COREF|nr:LytR C-terminal domain-containing protein [Corynebacterium efficiens]EEW51102.1 hypothetical protein HMPREF0290_0296 [Corynebacterium efficiens YS-314]BAC19385.1 hypothetical protein [Corynebacterium efficiens YS-314]
MTSDMQNPSSSDAGEPAGESTGAATRNSGLPMRGLAMILIAVAVLLAAWALWSMLNDGDESVTADTTTTAATTHAGEDTPAARDAGTETTTGTGDESGEGTPAGEPREDEGDSQRDDQREGQREGQPAPAPAAGESAVAQRPTGTPVTTLHVLNNSTVPQLAARVAESLESDFQKVESGNLPDVVIPRNTVYFTEGNPGAEQAARELADRVNGVAMERSPVLPEETGGKDALVLVLVEDVNL